MDRSRAIELLKDIITNKISVHGGNEEAISMAIEALEETHTLNGNTLTIKVSKEDIDKVKRIMLDCAPWCRTFYEDGKDNDAPTKEIVHCKDCKHYRAYAGRLDGYCYKAEWYNRYQNEDDFCSRGER